MEIVLRYRQCSRVHSRQQQAIFLSFLLLLFFLQKTLEWGCGWKCRVICVQCVWALGLGIAWTVWWEAVPAGTSEMCHPCKWFPNEPAHQAALRMCYYLCKFRRPASKNWSARLPISNHTMNRGPSAKHIPPPNHPYLHLEWPLEATSVFSSIN